MSLNITFLGHSGFIFDDGQHRVVVDPFLTGNDLAKHDPNTIDCQTLALTHGHEDHFGDTMTILENTGAQLIAAFEICNHVASQGHQNVNPGNPGGRIETDFGSITFTHAFHSSSYAGKYMGMPCGLIIDIGGVIIYHCGDTGLFSDMKLIGDIYDPEIALIPVGDRFTMGPELATRAAEMIGPKVAVPIHYKTFGLLRQDITGFEPSAVKVHEMQPGESWQYK